MKPERIVTLLMQAIGDEKLSEKTWKKIARLNKLILDTPDLLQAIKGK